MGRASAPRPLLLASVLALAVALCRCGSYSGTVIDGFPVGAPIECLDPACLADRELARSALHGREKDHAAVVSEAAYDEGGTGRRSVPLLVFVFVLADGRLHATGAVCLISGCLPLQEYPA
jgi:hypothetical protein